MDYKAYIFLVVSPVNATLMVILNIIEIFFLLKSDTKKRRKSFVYFINLAASDIFLGLLIILVKILTLFKENNGHSQVTTVRMFIQNKAISISLYISALTIAVSTFERMLAVKKPIYYSLIRFRTKCWISALIWFLAASVIVVLHFTVRDDELEYVVTPVIIFTTDLLAIVCFLVIRSTLQARMVNSSNNSSNVNRRQVHEKRFMLFCIKSFILFFLCWLSLAVFGVIFSSGILHNWKYLLEFRFTAHVIAFLNSVASPILFLVHNKAWKRLFRRKRTVKNKYVLESLNTSTLSGHRE